MIHPTAIIDPAARLGRNVSVGAYAVIGPQVEIGDNTEISNHVTIMGPTLIGRDNLFYSTCSIGQDPQDKKFKRGETQSRLEIGDNNTFREFVTINRGSEAGGGITRLGNNNWIMANCHIAHDCQVGRNTVFAVGAIIAGHVTIGDFVTLGGFTAIHQFCSVGEYTITGGQTLIAQDVPPYVVANGNRVRLFGVNKVGLERNGLTPDEVSEIQKAYKIIFRSKLPQKEALARVGSELGGSPRAMRLVEFIQTSTRGICR